MLSQPNSRILLGTTNETLLKYVYDGYTYAMGYKPIRKNKTRKQVRRNLHSEGLSQEEAHTLVGNLVALDELVNAKTYAELKMYVETLYEDVKFSYSLLSDLIGKVEECAGLEPLRDNLYRVRCENY